MIDFINNFHFLRPWYLLFLLLPFLLYLKKVNFGVTSSSWEDICDKQLFQFLLVDNKKGKRFSFKKFIYIGLISASIAVAGPSWKKVEVPAFEISNPNMFVLSVAQDMTLRDVTPSRLDRAKFLIQDIITGIKQGQFGLEVYSLEPYIISPITDDKELIINLLPQVNFDIMPDQGDRLDRAIDLAIKRFVDAKYSNGNIILFCADIGQRFDLAMEAVEVAKKKGYTVNVVDVSYEGNEKLALLAETGNGKYVKAKGGNIGIIIENISKTNDEKAKISQNLRSNYEDFGYYLLILPLICVLLFFRKGLFVFWVLCFSFEAQASAWLNDNQEGLKLFNEQRYEEAVKKFNNPIWRSIALYRMNKNEEALKEISKEEDEIALYNKGVILTKLCKYEEAKKVFDEVVKKYPNNEDAKYNKKVLEELFLKAKENPDLLKCGENQQQNNQNQQNDNQNKNNEKNDKKENQEQDKNSQGGNDKSEDKEENQQSNEEQLNKKSSNNEDKNKQDDDNKSSDEKENNNKNNENKNDNKNNNEENKKEESKEEKGNDTSDKNSLDKDNNDNAKQKDGDKENNESNEQGIQEKEAPVMGAKKTDKEEDFDEEAMILQRRYREIPDDTGGLLREFIKKEYLKDRYSDENI